MFRLAGTWALILTALINVSAFASSESVEEELQMNAHDEAGNDVKALKAEMLISHNDEMALKQLKKLLSKYKGSALEPSLQFRLAELYMRRAKTATFFEVQRQREDSAANFSPKATKSESSRQWVTKSVETYENIQRRFPHYRDMDLVLFNNAFARQILGQENTAVRLYKKVVNEYSDSPLVPDSHLAIGEVLFSQKAFQAAYDEFQKIRKYPEARVYPYGLYKGAWALYNLRKNEDGLKQLEEVVAYSKSGDEEESDNRLDLEREALEDMVVFYEDVKPPEDAVSYFKKQSSQTNYGSLILKLGRLYQRHGKHQQIEVVYRDLISDSPLTAERPEMHKELLESYEIRHKREKSVAELETFSELCSADSKWFKAQKAVAQKECVDEFVETGKLHIAKWHKEYNKTKTSEQGKFTRRAYEAVLDHGFKFSEEDKARFSYAELLFQLADYRKSSKQYSIAAHLTKDAKMKHDASYGALVALEKDVNGKWSDDDEALFSNLAADYISMNPHGQYLTDVKFKKAFIAYEKGKFDRAAPELRALAIAFSNTDRGKKAAGLYLDILNLKKQFAELKDESFYFIKKLSFDADTKKDFTKIHQQAYFTVVQDLENSKKYAEAMKGYEAFAKENPDSQLADKALLNAIRCANNDEDFVESARLSEILLKQYPQTTNKTEVTKNLISLYELQARLGDAAKHLLTLQGPEYLLKAADYQALDYEWTSALQTYSQVIQKYPNKDEAKKAKEKIAYIKEKKLHKLPAIYGEYNSAKKACDDKKYESCFKQAKNILSQKDDKDIPKKILAQTRMLQAQVLEKEFDQSSVKAKPDRLSLVLKIKADKLQRTQKAYQDVLNYGDKTIAIEALVKLAGVYGKFSQSLKSIEAPKELSEAEKNKFTEEIENMALPIEEKNAETLQIAMKQAKSLELHNGMLADIQSELNKLSRKNVLTKLSAEVNKPENYLPQMNSAKAQNCPKLYTQVKADWNEDDAVTAATSCYKNQDYNKVQDLAVDLSSREVKSPWGPYFHGLLAKDKNEFERAFWMTKLAQSRKDNSAYITYLEGQIYWSQNDYKLAMEFFEKALKKDNDIFPAHLILGQVYYEDTEYKQAEEEFEQALKENSKNQFALFGLAESKLRNKNIQEAASIYNRLTDLYPSDGFYLTRLAQIYENNLQDSREALSVYNNFKKKVRAGKITKNIDPDLDLKIKQLDAMIQQQREVANAKEKAK